VRSAGSGRDGGGRLGGCPAGDGVVLSGQHPPEGGVRGLLLVGGDRVLAPGLPDLAFGRWPSGVLTVRVVVGLGLGEGGQADQVHRCQGGPEDECAGAFGHGASPVDQLMLCERRADCLVVTAGHRASCHQPRADLDRPRRPGGRAPRDRRAWAACSRRSVMRCSASTWLSPACWLCMSFPFLRLRLLVAAATVGRGRR
jgi:hypothetical protein